MVVKKVNWGNGPETVSVEDDILLTKDAITQTKLDTIVTSLATLLTELQAKTEPTDGQDVEPVPLVRTAYSQAGVITINTVLATIDCQRFKSVSFDCISMGTTGVVTPEWSSDNATWKACTFFTPAGASATTFNAAGMWVVNVQARYLRFRLSTATTAGTTTINIDGCSVRHQYWLATQPVSGTVTATVATTTNIPSTGQGASTAHRTAFVANITTGAPTSVKASVGVINSLTVANNCGSGVWFHLYNKASAPTLGTDTPEASRWIPAGSTLVLDTGAFGDRFATGIAYAICDNCAAVPTVGGTITIATTATAICVSMRYT